MDILLFYPRDAMLLVLAIALCPSVCQTVTSRNSIETDDRIELVLAWELPSTYPTMCCKKIRVSPKIRVFPSGTLSKTTDWENFATAYRSLKRVINLARRRWTLRA